MTTTHQQLMDKVELCDQLRKEIEEDVQEIYGKCVDTFCDMVENDMNYSVEMGDKAMDALFGIIPHCVTKVFFADQYREAKKKRKVKEGDIK